jgi:uncharacterized Zn finger protein (UPF0148 family)
MSPLTIHDTKPRPAKGERSTTTQPVASKPSSPTRKGSKVKADTITVELTREEADSVALAASYVLATVDDIGPEVRHNFQCPICNVFMKRGSEKCPRCGTEFDVTSQPEGSPEPSEEATKALRESLWGSWGEDRETTDWPSNSQLAAALTTALPHLKAAWLEEREAAIKEAGEVRGGLTSDSPNKQAGAIRALRRRHGWQRGYDEGLEVGKRLLGRERGHWLEELRERLLGVRAFLIYSTCPDCGLPNPLRSACNCTGHCLDAQKLLENELALDTITPEEDCDDPCRCGHVRHEHHYFPDPDAGPETGRCAHCDCERFTITPEEGEQ